jgi:hypothetical protein
MRVLETAVRSAVLGEVREELRERSPQDGYRPYDGVRLSPDIHEAFAKVAEGKGDDVVIDPNAIVDAYATTLKSDVRAANQRGPKWLTASEAKGVSKPVVRDRVTALRAELSLGQKDLSMDALERRAARFIADHSAPTGDSGNAIDVFFPAFDVGNGEDWSNGVPGISGTLVTNGRDALKLLKMYEGDASDEELARLRTFNPRKEYLIVVRDSDDETKHYPAAIDKKTGKARGFDSVHNEADFLSEEDDAYDKMQKVFDRNRSLPIEKTSPPSLDKAALTKAAAVAVQDYLAGLRAIPASLDLSETDRTTLEAIRAAIADGQQITVGESHGDPILMMPRKFAGTPTEDWAVGWAVNELTKQTPSLKRFYNVNATPAV